MTVVVEGSRSFFLGSRAVLLDDTRELAWAEKHVAPNPAIGWVLGKYVEADRANRNNQYWALDQLQMAQPSINHAPMNLLHHPRDVIGAFVATEMMYPLAAGTEGEGAAEGEEPTGEVPGSNPYIEALGVVWKYYFPEEFAQVETAYKTGSLFFSMECIANSITCAGDTGCTQEFEYMGPRHQSYCDHLNEGKSVKQLNKPHFLAGALIFPPERPGWHDAHITDLAGLMKSHQSECEKAYAGVKEEMPHLDPAQWEYMMGMIVRAAAAEYKPHAYSPSEGPGSPCKVCGQAADASCHPKDESRDIDTETRKRMAKKGQAMPDKSFPIANAGDLKNAIKLAGKAKDPAAAKRHIVRRARALGLTKLLPEGW